MLAAVGVAVCVSDLASAEPPDTGLTYQGVLKQNGSLVNTPRDMRFQLYNTATAGSPLYSIEKFAVEIEDGVFSVDLDFGASPWSPNVQYWMKIEAGPPDGSQSYESIGRQKLAATPYALNTRGILVRPNGDVRIDPDETGMTPQSFSPLSVLGVGSTYINVLTADPDRNAGILFGDSDDVDAAGIIYRHDEDLMSFRTNGNSEKMRLTGEGRLVVSGPLTVWGLPDEPYCVDLSGPQDPGIHIKALGTFSAWGIYHDDVTDNLVFRDTTFNENRMVIRGKNGNVGIGIDDPPLPLSVLGGVGVTSLSNIGSSNVLHVFTELFKTDGPIIIGAETTEVGTSMLEINTGPSNPSHINGIRAETQVHNGTAIMGVHSTGGEGAAVHGQGNGRAAVRGENHNVADTGWGSAMGGCFEATGEWSIGVRGESAGEDGIGVHGLASSTAFIPSGLGTVGVMGESYMPNLFGSGGMDFYAIGAGLDYGSNSSRRWKSEVAPISGALDKLEQIRGVTYTWDEEHGGHPDVGFIAEEVGEVLPEIVIYESNRVDAIAMDYGKVSPLIVQAVKELRAEKDAEIAALRAEIESLKSRMDSSGMTMVRSSLAWPVAGVLALGGIAALRRRGEQNS